MDAPDTKSLPENAYRPLAPGEVYMPRSSPRRARQEEATVRSVGWGLFLCVVFTVASAYSGLKVGQVMEASIPISILAIGLARVFRRRSTLLENVILTSIGGTSGGMVAGAIFTLPALYILNLDPHPLQTIFILLAGGCLGVLFLIPLRRYFVREMHGQSPVSRRPPRSPRSWSPARRAARRPSSSSRRPASPAVYDFFVTTFQVWREIGRLPVHARRCGRSPTAPASSVRFDAIALHPRPRLRHGPALVDDPVRRRRPLELRAGAADLDDRPAPPGPRRSIPATVPIAGMDAAHDLPQLRPLHRRGRHRHGGHLRHHQVAAHRRRLLRRSPPRPSSTARTRARSAPTATCRS